MLEMCDGSLVEKQRYLFKQDNHVWEVDEFMGDNRGLVVAEIELERADEEFSKPDWVGEEVSDDARYLNARLVQNPFRNW